MRRTLLGVGGSTTVAVAVAVVVLGGSGGGTDLAAAVTVVDERVARTTGDADPQPARTGDRLQIGDRVRTDDSGRARLDYTDGSLARLGPRTELTLVELGDDAGQRRIRTRLDVGETWHRVRALSGTDDPGAYEVETAVATASVRGTAFAVVCLMRDRCTFTVAEGEVEILPRDGPSFTLRAGDSVTIAGDEVGDVVVLSPDQLRSDPWIGDNLALDREDEPEDEVTALTTTTEHRQAVVAGDWDLAMTTLASPGGVRDGERVDRSYRFDVEDCDERPCPLIATIESGAGPQVVPMAFRDGAYRFETTFLLACDDVADAVRTTLRWQVEVADVEPDDRGWRATALSGTVEETQEANRPSDCETGTLRHDLTARRT